MQDTANTTTTGARARTPETVNEPLDIHKEYRWATEWMFRDRTTVKLPSGHANKLAAGLTAIIAIQSVLLAETTQRFTLDNYVKTGLLLAADKLAVDCMGGLEQGEETALPPATRAA